MSTDILFTSPCTPCASRAFHIVDSFPMARETDVSCFCSYKQGQRDCWQHVCRTRFASLPLDLIACLLLKNTSDHVLFHGINFEQNSFLLVRTCAGRVFHVINSFWCPVEMICRALATSRNNGLFDNTCVPRQFCVPASDLIACLLLKRRIWMTMCLSWDKPRTTFFLLVRTCVEVLFCIMDGFPMSRENDMSRFAASTDKGLFDNVCAASNF